MQISGTSGYQYDFTALSQKKSEDSSKPSFEDMAASLMENLDTDGDGVIDTEELESNEDLSEEQLAKLAEADADGDGSLTSEELTAQAEAMHAEMMAKLQMMQGQGGGQMVPAPPPEEDADEMASSLLDSLDEDGDGVIDAEELQSLMANGAIDEDQFAKLQEADADADGSLTLEELTEQAEQMMSGGNSETSATTNEDQLAGMLKRALSAYQSGAFAFSDELTAAMGASSMGSLLAAQV